MAESRDADGGSSPAVSHETYRAPGGTRYIDYAGTPAQFTADMDLASDLEVEILRMRAEQDQLRRGFRSGEAEALEPGIAALEAERAALIATWRP